MKKLTIIFILTLNINILFSAPSPKIWTKWDHSNSTSTKVIDHSLWQIFLDKNVKKTKDLNLVNYSKVSDSNYNLLLEYIASISNLKITELNKNEQKALWVNLYNALTIKVVLDNYPVSSIKKINISGLFKVGPWDKKLITIENEDMSLNDIEHRILRPIWNDYKIHYALNCASKSCPELQMEAFTSNNIENLLNSAESKYLNSKYGYEVDGNTIILSSIFNWFDTDFGDSEKEVIEYLKSIIEINDYTKIKYNYDWSLNDILP